MANFIAIRPGPCWPCKWCVLVLTNHPNGLNSLELLDGRTTRAQAEALARKKAAELGLPLESEVEKCPGK